MAVDLVRAAMLATFLMSAVGGAKAWGDVPRPKVGASVVESSAPGLTVPSSIMEAHMISKQLPKYPTLAKLAHQQGTVTIHAVITAEGTVQDLLILHSAGKYLDKNAMDAVRHWRCRPYEVQGKAVQVETVINVTYKLGK